LRERARDFRRRPAVSTTLRGRCGVPRALWQQSLWPSSLCLVSRTVCFFVRRLGLLGCGSQWGKKFGVVEGEGRSAGRAY
jgi:hypothetical protein